MTTIRLSSLVCGVLLAAPLSSQQFSHSDGGGVTYTVTRVSWTNDPLPLSDSYSGLLSQAQATALAGPSSASGSAFAQDIASGYDMSAEATDWHSSKWHITAQGQTAGLFVLSVGGQLVAGGWTNMMNPSCAAMAACAHSASVDLPQGVNSAHVYLCGWATSLAGLVNWGQITVKVATSSVAAEWQVNPWFEVHTTGESPIGGGGGLPAQPGSAPKPGEQLDAFAAWGFTNECMLRIQSGIAVRAYADGAHYGLFFDVGEAASKASTSCTISIGGREVSMSDMEGLVPLDGGRGGAPGHGGGGGH
jgi:hypothetical protein